MLIGGHERRAYKRANVNFETSFSTFEDLERLKPIYFRPLQEQFINLSAGGIALNVGSEPDSWVDCEIAIVIRWPSKEYITASATFVRIIEDKPGWMAFTFTSIEDRHRSMIDGYIDVWNRTYEGCGCNSLIDRSLGRRGG